MTSGEHEIVWRPAVPSPTLEAGSVDVWRVALDRDPGTVAEFRTLLSLDERQRADRFHFPVHRNRFTVGRGVLRRVLGRYLDLPPSSLQFAYGEHGKPCLVASSRRQDLEFNVSHAADVALLGITRRRPLGIDIEEIRRDDDLGKLAERYFSPREVVALRALPPALRRTGFFDCWTRKEAYIKAVGAGLTMPLDGFSVSLSPGEPAALLHAEGDPDAGARWTFRELDVGDRFRAALAVKEPINSLNGWYDTFYR